MRDLKSFKIRFKNKIFDYRESEDLDLQKVNNFFSKKYKIEKLWKAPRHILGILIDNNQKYFLKLSTSEGIGLITKNEHNWNNYFNKYNSNKNFSAPKNFESGIFEKKYYYLITSYFKGKLLCNINQDANSLINHINKIILLSETIQNLPGTDFTLPEYEEKNYKKRFLNKMKDWFEDIPADIVKKYKINDLLKIVEEGIDKLDQKSRHGDFTPWHIINLGNNKLGLIDGEHALPDGVENYDVCYFIQRVFSVLESSDLAKEIYNELIKRGYNSEKLKIVLSSRALGGFLDCYLDQNLNYKFAEDFKNWVLST